MRHRKSRNYFSCFARAISSRVFSPSGTKLPLIPFPVFLLAAARFRCNRISRNATRSIDNQDALRVAIFRCRDFSLFYASRYLLGDTTCAFSRQQDRKVKSIAGITRFHINPRYESLAATK